MDAAQPGVIGIVLQVGIILAVPILGLSILGLVIDRLLGTSPLALILLLAAGNVIGWAGVRRLYLRERRRSGG